MRTFRYVAWVRRGESTEPCGGLGRFLSCSEIMETNVAADADDDLYLFSQIFPHHTNKMKLLTTTASFQVSYHCPVHDLSISSKWTDKHYEHADQEGV